MMSREDLSSLLRLDATGDQYWLIETTEIPRACPGARYPICAEAGGSKATEINGASYGNCTIDTTIWDLFSDLHWSQDKKLE